MKYRITAFFERLGFIHLHLKADSRASAVEATKTIMQLVEAGDHFITEVDGLKETVFFAAEGAKDFPTYGVIYDVKVEDDDDREEYYEAFVTPEEATRMFNETFGSDPSVHNARLVRILQTIKAQT